MSDYRELLLGCGAKQEKFPFGNLTCKHQLFPDNHRVIYTSHPCTKDNAVVWPAEFQNVTTLDNNPDHKPNIVWDLHDIPIEIKTKLSDKVTDNFIVCNTPLPSNTFNEIHAYEVLEHVGRQGDYRTFFNQFTEFWRLLKPGGLFFATCPSWCSPWAWGDPSHTRVLTAGTLSFLSQRQYVEQVGKTPMSDFRSIYTADFEPIFVTEDNDALRFVLRAVK